MDSRRTLFGLLLLTLLAGAAWLARQPPSDSVRKAPGPSAAAAPTLGTTSPPALAEGSFPGEEYTNTLGMTLCWIPPGSFTMGSPEGEEGRSANEGPQHPVTIRQGFWLGKTEVTRGEWKALIGSYEPEEKLRLPADRVSWSDAQKFATELTQSEHSAGTLPESWSYRLPSEAEWEYAARAGTTGARYGDVETIAWYGGEGAWKVRPVGQKVANPWGLHDMLGNMAEWCQDPWHPNYQGAPGDGSVWNAGGTGDRVARGGSWFNGPRSSRAAFRYHYDPSHRHSTLGLRIAAGPTTSPGSPTP